MYPLIEGLATRCWYYAQQNPYTAIVSVGVLTAVVLLRKKVMAFAVGFFAGIVVGALITGQVQANFLVVTNPQATMLVWGILGGCLAALKA